VVLVLWCVNRTSPQARGERGKSKMRIASQRERRKNKKWERKKMERIRFRQKELEI